MARRKSLAERLGFKGLGCCAFKIFNSDPGFVNEGPVANGIALGERLAADAGQQLWGSDNGEDGSAQSTPTRPESLPESPLAGPSIRLLEALEFEEDEIVEENRDDPDTVCCVCMVRKKGSALIPCGHTFCRACSRKLYLERGACPLCNSAIITFLGLF